MFVSTKKGVGALLSVHVQPRCSRNCIDSIYDDAVKVCTTAPPAAGKANKAIIIFLASSFKIAKKDVELVSGAASRRKRFLLRGMTEVEVREHVLAQIKS